MICAWHLLWIIPLSITAGALMMIALSIMAWAADDPDETDIDK